MEVIISTRRSVSNFIAHQKCVSLLLFLLGFAALIYYLYSHSAIKDNQPSPRSSLHKYQDHFKNTGASKNSKPHQDGVKNAVIISSSSEGGAKKTVIISSNSEQHEVGAQTPLGLNVWQPKNHKRRNFADTTLNAPGEILNARKEAKTSTIIYIYNPPEKISDVVRITGGWEQHFVNPLLNYLLKDPTLHFIDIGTMIGVYTLQVANIGHKVVGVDANKENIWRLGQAVLDNQFAAQVTLVHNVIDTTHGLRYLRTNKADLGAAFVEKEKKDKEQSPVAAITADELLPAIPFKRAVLKVDIENYEYEFLQNASKLFEKIDIPIVIMDYNAPKRTTMARDFIKNFMKTRNFFPHSSIESTTVLNPDDTQWPNDIVWKRDKGKPTTVNKVK